MNKENTKKPKLLIFASGSATSGGSGFENLVRASENGLLNAEIVGVVSNHEAGGVREKALRLGVRFIHFQQPWTAEKYQIVARESGADFFALSGWLKLVTGLRKETNFNSKTVFNIHPGPLPEFGGKGMYGHHVHEAVIEAYKEGKVTHSAICMHFVTEEYDRGPIFFRFNVKIDENDTAETLAERVNTHEHRLQPIITDLVVNEKIYWDGSNHSSLQVPDDYSIIQGE